LSLISCFVTHFLISYVYGISIYMFMVLEPYVYGISVICFVTHFLIPLCFRYLYSALLYKNKIVIVKIPILSFNSLSIDENDNIDIVHIFSLNYETKM